MKKLLSLITICMITTLCISINSSAATLGDNLTYDKVSNAEIATKTNHFFQEGTIHITNKQEIKEYQESMGLKYDPDVIEICHTFFPPTPAAGKLFLLNSGTKTAVYSSPFD